MHKQRRNTNARIDFAKEKLLELKEPLGEIFIMSHSDFHAKSMISKAKVVNSAPIPTMEITALHLGVECVSIEPSHRIAPLDTGPREMARLHTQSNLYDVLFRVATPHDHNSGREVLGYKYEWRAKLEENPIFLGESSCIRWHDRYRENSCHESY